MKMGYIPGNDNLTDPYESVFTVPREFTVDEGNDLKMRLAALGRGIISRGRISELDGLLAEEVEEEREAEEDRMMGAAERLHEKHKWISQKECLLRMDAGETNISFADAIKEQVIDTETGQPLNPDGTVQEGAPTNPGDGGKTPAKPAAPEKKPK
jgi:hypothetical protein